MAMRIQQAWYDVKSIQDKTSYSDDVLFLETIEILYCDSKLTDIKSLELSLSNFYT